VILEPILRCQDPKATLAKREIQAQKATLEPILQFLVPKETQERKATPASRVILEYKETQEL